MCAKRIFLPDPRTALTNEMIIDKIPRGSRVVDLGCGDPELIERLHLEHACEVLGVERDEDSFVRGIERGVPMLQADLNEGLAEIPDQCFDFAILSQTLQQIHRPVDLLNEIFRIARRALVVVPNFAHWRIRMQVALQGRAPVTDHLPYEWYDSPNVHFLSLLDFRELAAQGNFQIIRELPIIGNRAVKQAAFVNLRAHSALYVLERSTAETRNITNALNTKMTASPE